MVFNDSVLSNAVIIVLIVWNLLVTIFVFRIWRHYNRLTQGFTSRNLQDILESLLSEYSNLKKNVKSIEGELKSDHEDGKYHVQRVGILRFNPFSDTGGSQSFTIAILDGKLNGIVMTSLYARTGNRWYAKEVRSGKGKDIELSKEEIAAISKAAPINK